jgi:hypothetical protein
MEFALLVFYSFAEVHGIIGSGMFVHILCTGGDLAGPCWRHTAWSSCILDNFRSLHKHLSYDFWHRLGQRLTSEDRSEQTRDSAQRCIAAGPEVSAEDDEAFSWSPTFWTPGSKNLSNEYFAVKLHLVPQLFST